MAEQNGDLTHLAELAAKMPEERRRLLEDQLAFACDLKFDAGLVAGLALAAEFAAEHLNEKAARPLQETAAVAAAHVLLEQQAFNRLREQQNTPECRAQLEAEVELIRTGQVAGIPIEMVLHDMEAVEAFSKPDDPNGMSGE